MSARAPLRAGRDADAVGFIALITACWAEYPGCVMDLDGENPELRALATYYAGKGGALWAAEQAGRVVGMVATKPLGDGSWELCRMYAAAETRGSGLAQTLIAAAEGHARSHGATAMKLWTDTRFDRAHRFYEKCGYLRDGPIRALDDVSHSIEFAYAKPFAGVVVKRLDAAGAASAERALAGVLLACNEADGAASFLPPLAEPAARAFWRRSASEVALGQRVLLVAWADGALAGTVMLDLAMPANQRHRGEVERLLVHPGLRRRGIARALMARVEQEAAAEGRRLLTLHTGAGGPAEPLCHAMGWREGGRIPGFALNADGTPRAAVIFYKEIAARTVAA